MEPSPQPKFWGLVIRRCQRTLARERSLREARPRLDAMGRPDDSPGLMEQLNRSSRGVGATLAQPWLHTGHVPEGDPLTPL